MVLSSSVSFDTLLWVVLSFFFVESKSFEFSVEEGGTFYLLRINERGKDSLRSVFMGKQSAKRLLSIWRTLFPLSVLDTLHEPSEMRCNFYSTTRFQ